MIKIPATDYGKSGLALMIVGSANQPQWLAIGSGSGTFAVDVGSLYAEVKAERLIWTTRNLATAKEIAIQHDYNSVQMSGIVLREFGIGAGSTTDQQDLWHHEHFIGVTFDGTLELQIEVTFQVF